MNRVSRPSVEVNVLDFDGDLYGKEVAVDWIKHLTPEEKFDSVDALIEQMVIDKQQARDTFGTKTEVAIQKSAWYYK